MHAGADAAVHRFSDKESVRERLFRDVWIKDLNAVFADVAPYYDRASNVASLGLCDAWRRRLARTVALAPGHKVLDVCAGTNAVGRELMRRQPDIQLCAIDRSGPMQFVGRDLAQADGFHIDGMIGDAHKLPFRDDSFDVATLSWASRHLRVGEVFSEIRRVLKPGGRFYHCDMLRPSNKVVEALYSGYLNACVAGTALFFGSAPQARRCRTYFVRAIQMFYSADELSDLLRELGFTGVSADVAPGGVLAIHQAQKA